MRIAVVGAGIASASFCRFVRDFEDSSDEPITVDVYECASIVGGRLRTELVGAPDSQKRYEVGGAVLHKSNRHMKEFCDELGLERIFDTGNDVLLLAGGVNNSSVILRIGGRWFTTIKLIYRYGFDVFRLYFTLRRQISSLFSRIYAEHQKFVCCDDVIQLLKLFTPHATDKNACFSFQQQCCRPLRDELSTFCGFSRRFVDEIAQAAARVNYGQTVDDLHGFVGLISLAGAQNGSLWHVEGGNDRVVQGLLKKHATKLFLDHRVGAVEFSPSSNLSRLTVRRQNGTTFAAEYDCVVVACPLAADNIKFENADSRQPLFKNLMPFKYQRIVTTLVGPGAEPMDADFNNLPIREVDAAIFLTPPVADASNSTPMPFNSVAVVKAADFNPSWWKKCVLLLLGMFSLQSRNKFDKVRKVFSSVPFNVCEYFSSGSVAAKSVVVEWHAYPQYSPIRKWFADYFNGNFDTVPRHKSLPVTMKFKLTQQRGLYYINAIETLGSAMEMSAIGAKNVALLTKRDFIL